MGRDQGVKKVCIVLLIPINVRLGGGRENVSLMCIRAMRGRENFRSNLKLFLNFGLGKLGFIVISLSFCPSFHLSVGDHLSGHILSPLGPIWLMLHLQSVFRLNVYWLWTQLRLRSKLNYLKNLCPSNVYLPLVLAVFKVLW